MNNHKKLVDYCKDRDGHGKIFGVPAALIKLAGGIEEGFFLNQLIYWSDKGKRKDGYFYKTDKDWKDELGLTRYKLERMRNKFVNLGYITVIKKKANGAPTNHYRVHMKKIFADLAMFNQKHGKDNKTNSVGNNADINQIVLSENHNSELQDSSDSELSESDNSLTDNTHILTHTVEQKNAVLPNENNNKGIKGGFVLPSDGPEFEPKVYRDIVDQIKEMTKKEKLTEKEKATIRRISMNVNLQEPGNYGWDENRTDLGYILTILDWAKSKIEKCSNLSVHHILIALLNREKLDDWRANYRYSRFNYRKDYHENYQNYNYSRAKNFEDL